MKKKNKVKNKLKSKFKIINKILNMFYLFFDTETNARTVCGNFSYKQSVIQLSYTICDKDFNILKTNTYFISDLAKKIYPNQKILTLNDIKHGQKWESVYNEFIFYCNKIKKNKGKLIAHNIEFDANVIIYSCQQKKIDFNPFLNIIREHSFCTKRRSTDFCKLPKIGYASKYPGYKWPTLEELYFKLFNENIEQEHLADKDVEILLKCFKKGKKLDIF